MEYCDFKETIVSFVKERVGSSSVNVVSVVKVNDICLDAIIIRDCENNVSPTIYLNGFYDRFISNEEKELDAIVDEIVDIHNKNKIDENVDMNFFFDFEKVRDHIIYRIINRDKNKKLLSSVPFIEYLDLAIVFYYYIDREGFPEGYVLIDNTHMSKWNVSATELFDEAAKNTPSLLEFEIIDFNKLIADKLDDEEQKVFADPETLLPIYILTNNTKSNGASCILYEKLLKNISDRSNSSFYVLPSSVHETLLVFEDEKEDMGVDFGRMVKEINSTVLSDDEFLSDHAYYFDRNRNELMIAG